MLIVGNATRAVVCRISFGRCGLPRHPSWWGPSWYFGCPWHWWESWFQCESLNGEICEGKRSHHVYCVPAVRKAVHFGRVGLQNDFFPMTTCLVRPVLIKSRLKINENIDRAVPRPRSWEQLSGGSDCMMHLSMIRMASIDCWMPPLAGSTVSNPGSSSVLEAT